MHWRFGEPKESQRIAVLDDRSPQRKTATLTRPRLPALRGTLPISLLMRADVLVREGQPYHKSQRGEPVNPQGGAAIYFWRDGEIVEVHKAGPTAAEERALQQKIADLFREQGKVLSNSEIQEAIQSGTPLLLADQVDWEHGIAKPLLDDIEVSRLAQFQKAGEGAVKGYRELRHFGPSLSFKVTNPRSVHFLRVFGAQLVTDITQETKAGLRQLLVTAYKEGLSIDQTANMIRGGIGVNKRQAISLRRYTEAAHAELPEAIANRRIERFTQKLIGARATMIARTELLRASNQGELEGWRQLQDEGIFETETVKIAMIAYDERTCDECLELDGEEVPLKEAFSNGVDAPPFHPECRCTIYVVPKDMPRQESMIPEKDRAALEERGLTLQPPVPKEELQWPWEQKEASLSAILGHGRKGISSRDDE